MSTDELFLELKKEYIESIPEKIQEIEGFYNEKDSDGLINAFHKLKGSGKTYGVEEISILGLKFEMALKENLDGFVSNTPIAIELLKKIYLSRLSGTPFDISNDLEFKSLD